MFLRKIGLLLAALMLASSAVAQPSAFIEGKDFVLVEPVQATDAPKGNIEVVEFFSYSCPHCARFDPALSDWVKKLPKDVSFRRSPVVFQESWLAGARLYFALEASKQLDKFHSAVFTAVHQENLPILTDAKALSDWITKGGGDAKAVSAAMTSFYVQSRMAKAENQARAYQVLGVPAMAVDGRYMSKAESRADPLLLTSFLLTKVRAQAAVKK